MDRALLELKASEYAAHYGSFFVTEHFSKFLMGFALSPSVRAYWRDESDSKLLEALRELVELKEMKDEIDENFYNPDAVKRIKEDYQRRKPLAWQAAREIIKDYGNTH